MGIGFDPKKEYEEIVVQAASLLGFTVYEHSVRLKGVNSKIQVKIDGNTPVTHGDCERYSRELSRLLDEKGTLPNYMLEISSPGLKRRISTQDEFLRFKGSPVKVIYNEQGTGRVAKGTLVELSDAEITVKEGKKDIVIPFGAIKSANLDY